MKEIQEQIIDVANISLGRAASDVARILMGKNDLDFARNKVSRVRVTVRNVSLLKMSESKKIKNKYYTHSGYLGNLKSKTLGELFEESPEKMFLKTVSGMLPDNKIKKLRLKNIIFQK